MPVSKYQTALKLARPKPGHIKREDDQNRVAAYDTYEDIYRNVEAAFTAVMRDDSDNEISRRYVPSARTIIEAANRYLAKDPTIMADPMIVNPDGTTVEADPNLLVSIMKLWNDFTKREEFFTKFLSLKRWMMVRGDSAFHLMADDTKPDGTRLRIVEINPSTYFTLTNPVDPERIDGVYIVNIIDDDEGEPVAMRQEYRKMENGAIHTRLSFYETDGWDDRLPLTEADLKEVDPPSAFAGSDLLAGFDLPAPIDSIPVYLYRNHRDSDAYGTSELQGIETLIAGINQTATDEDVTMALTGIGVYVTTSGTPRDSQGNEQDWVIAPASVLELEDKLDKFERVQGVTTIQPMLDHSGYLEEQAQRTTGTPAVAVGRVEVSIAESGIALALQMDPILAKNQEKELELKSKSDHLLFDWLKWAQAYEGLNAQGVTLSITFGDPMPVDRTAVLKEITEMVTNKLISIEFAQGVIRDKLGYDIPTDMMAKIVAETEQMTDATGARLDVEAGTGGV